MSDIGSGLSLLPDRIISSKLHSPLPPLRQIHQRRDEAAAAGNDGDILEVAIAAAGTTLGDISNTMENVSRGNCYEKSLYLINIFLSHLRNYYSTIITVAGSTYSLPLALAPCIIQFSDPSSPAGVWPSRGLRPACDGARKTEYSGNFLMVVTDKVGPTRERKRYFCKEMK